MLVHGGESGGEARALVLARGLERRLEAKALCVNAAAHVEVAVRAYVSAGEERAGHALRGLRPDGLNDLTRRRVNDRNLLRLARVVTGVEDDEATVEGHGLVRKTPALDLPARGREPPAVRKLRHV